MKYTHTYNTLWHDTDASRVLRIGSIQKYLQETGNLQCESFGLPLDGLRDGQGLGFILSKIAIKVYKPLRAYETIDVNTWCTDTRGYSFQRYFDIVRNGETAVRASSQWALVDINKHTLVRCSDWLATHFPYDTPIDASMLPPYAHIGRTQSLEHVGKRVVGYSDIDYNMHMNNTHYPDMLCDFLPDMQGKYVSDIAISFIKEAPLGATLDVLRAEGDGGEYMFRTQNGDGQVCIEAAVRVREIE